MPVLRSRTCFPATLALVASLAACEQPTGVGNDIVSADALEVRLGPDVVFLSMRESPEAHMDALFEGRVVLDDAGCLRVDSPDPATIVWPRGWSHDLDGDAIRIRDSDGEAVGRVGEDFHLGGGEVDELPAAMGFSQDDQVLAHNHCPGKYWIVAGV